MTTVCTNWLLSTALNHHTEQQLPHTSSSYWCLTLLWDSEPIIDQDATHTARPIWSHKCSMGLRSGLHDCECNLWWSALYGQLSMGMCIVILKNGIRSNITKVRDSHWLKNLITVSCCIEVSSFWGITVWICPMTRAVSTRDKRDILVPLA